VTTHQDVQREFSTGFPPIPYFPQLCRVLGGVTISIVFVYLEIHHSPLGPDPDAQPARAGLRTPSVTLDCDQACADLGVSRRTLHTALDALSVWWKHEGARSAAARSSRDFLRTSHSLDGGKLEPIRPYALVGSRKWTQARTLVIHRNLPRLDQIVSDAGLITASRCTSYEDTSRPSSVVGSLAGVLEIEPQKRGLAWGWSQERVREHSARMTRLWAERRQNGLVGGSRRG
jgi:hypothetical protein